MIFRISGLCLPAILSVAAETRMIAEAGDEILRCTQDDGGRCITTPTRARAHEKFLGRSRGGALAPPGGRFRRSGRTESGHAAIGIGIAIREFTRRSARRPVNGLARVGFGPILNHSVSDRWPIEADRALADVVHPLFFSLSSEGHGHRTAPLTRVVASRCASAASQPSETRVRSRAV